jgi:hypothetical protein
MKKRVKAGKYGTGTESKTTMMVGPVIRSGGGTAGVGVGIRRQKTSASSNSMPEMQTFEEVLRSVPGRRAFEKHLAYEFAIESLMFCKSLTH